MSDPIRPRVYVVNSLKMHDSDDDMYTPTDQKWYLANPHYGYVELAQYNDLLRRFNERGRKIAKLKAKPKRLKEFLLRKGVDSTI